MHPEGHRLPRPSPAACARQQPRRAHQWRRPVTILTVGVLAVLAVGWWSTPAQGRPAATTGHPAGHFAVPGSLAAGVAAADDGPVTDTSWGALTAADRDLLVTVKLAGLWEILA